jgi:hypothetical protein
VHLNVNAFNDPDNIMTRDLHLDARDAKPIAPHKYLSAEKSGKSFLKQHQQTKPDNLAEKDDLPAKAKLFFSEEELKRGLEQFDALLGEEEEFIGKEIEELQKEKKELDASLKNMAVEHENQRGQKFTMVCTLSVVAGFCFVFSTAPSL